MSYSLKFVTHYLWRVSNPAELIDKSSKNNTVGKMSAHEKLNSLIMTGVNINLHLTARVVAGEWGSCNPHRFQQ